MLTPQELEQVHAHGIVLEGEGVYYVEISPGSWVLTLKGHRLYRYALAYYGLKRCLAGPMTHSQLLELDGALLRARTLQIGHQMEQALQEGQVSARERPLLTAFLQESLEHALQVAEHHARCSKAGVLPGPCPAPG